MTITQSELIDEEIAILGQFRDHMRARAKTDLLSFISCINQKFQINWHHRIIADRLSKLRYQKSQRLMIFVQPQTGKSEIVSRALPAWLLGINPDLRVIVASYASDLAVSFNRDTQKIIDGAEYESIFPNTMLNGRRNVTGKSYKRTSDFFEIVDHKGYLFSVGVGGATTGKAADVFIVDDPIKDWKQAYSPTYRESIMDWYNSVALTRMSLNGHVVIMHTRWHEADLAGQLLQKMKDEPDATRWEVISLPATGLPAAEYRHPKDLREFGEPLWPSFKGDAAALAKLKIDVGEKVWSSLYQQSPTIEGGNIIKAEWIHYYTELPFQKVNLRHHNTIQSWDLSFKETGTSYVVCLVIVFWEGFFYVIDCYRKKAGFVETLEAVQAMRKKYPHSCVLIEDKANGAAIMDSLKTKIPGIIAVEPDASKDERLQVVAPFFERGEVLFPFNAPWTKDLVHELQAFPNAPNDDTVDAISQGLRHFNEQQGIRHLKATSKW